MNTQNLGVENAAWNAMGNALYSTVKKPTCLHQFYNPNCDYCDEVLTGIKILAEDGGSEAEELLAGFNLNQNGYFQKMVDMYEKFISSINE